MVGTDAGGTDAGEIPAILDGLADKLVAVAMAEGGDCRTSSRPIVPAYPGQRIRWDATFSSSWAWSMGCDESCPYCMSDGSCPMACEPHEGQPHEGPTLTWLEPISVQVRSQPYEGHSGAEEGHPQMVGTRSRCSLRATSHPRHPRRADARPPSILSANTWPPTCASVYLAMLVNGEGAGVVSVLLRQRIALGLEE